MLWAHRFSKGAQYSIPSFGVNVETLSKTKNILESLLGIIIIYQDLSSTNHWYSFLVGGLEHFSFSHILRIVIPIDFPIFQRNRSTTSQFFFAWYFPNFSHFPRHMSYKSSESSRGPVVQASYRRMASLSAPALGLSEWHKDVTSSPRLISHTYMGILVEIGSIYIYTHITSYLRIYIYIYTNNFYTYI